MTITSAILFVVVLGAVLLAIGVDVGAAITWAITRKKVR
jgi:hypothetical protein